MILDAHTHIFPRICGRTRDGATRGAGYGRASVGDVIVQLWPPLNPETIHTPEMLIAQMDGAGVDKAVLLQGPFYGECNAYVADAVRRYPDRFVGAAYLDPWEDDCRCRYAALRDWGVFRAVKLECSDATGYCGVHPGARLDAPYLAWLWDELELGGVVLVLDLGAVGASSYQTGAVRLLAESHPALNIVICHLGQPDRSLDDDDARRCQWREQVGLALLPNVYLDTAALPAYFSHEPYPWPRAARFIREGIDLVGPGKILWGSDIPGLLCHATYPKLLAAAKDHLRFLDATDSDRVLGSNAWEIFRPR